MAGFSFASPDTARAAIYDAALLLLAVADQADLPVDSQTIFDLQKIIGIISEGRRLCPGSHLGL
jgi:hypothetical protein